MGGERAGREGLRGLPTENAPPDALARPRSLLRFGLILLLLWAPLPFGSVEPWAVLTLELAAALLGAFGIVLLVVEGTRPSRPFVLALLGWLGILGIAALQVAPLPGGPISVSPPDTVDAALRWFAYGLVGIAAAAAFRTRRHFVHLAVAILAAGVFQAVYGAAEFLSGNDSIFGYKKRYYVDVATGTFINRNHFAGFLALSVPFGLALVGEARRRRPGGDRYAAAALVAGALLATSLLWLGILLSQSRGGLAAALVGTVAFAALSGARRSLVWIGAGVLAVPVLFLLWQDVEVPGRRFAEVDRDVTAAGGRAEVWRESLALAAERPWLGTGLGTFEAAFEAAGGDRVGLRYDHAHSEPVQASLEIGLAGLALLAGIAVTVWRALAGGIRASARPAIGAALIAAAAHALVDFGWRIPALATLAAILVATAAAARAPGATAAEPRVAYR